MADVSTAEAPARPVDEQLDALQSMGMAALRERFREVFGEEPRTHNVAYLRKKIAWRIQELAEGGLSELARGRIRELSKTSPIRHRGQPQPRAPRDVWPAEALALAAAELQASEAPALLEPPALPPPALPPPVLPPSPPLPEQPAPPAALLVMHRRNLAALSEALPGADEPPAPAPSAPVLAPSPRHQVTPAPVVPPAAAAPKAPGACEVVMPAARPSGRDPRLPPAGSRIRRTWSTCEHLVIVLDEGFLYNGESFSSLSRVARKITGSNWNGFTFFGLTSPWKGSTP